MLISSVKKERKFMFPYVLLFNDSVVATREEKTPKTAQLSFLVS